MPKTSRIYVTSPMITHRRRQHKRPQAKSETLYIPKAGGPAAPINPFRAVSITSAMQSLTIESEKSASSVGTDACPGTPSYIPLPIPPLSTPCSSPSATSPSKRPASPCKLPDIPQFLSRFTNVRAAWDPTTRIEEMEQSVKQLYTMNERMEASMNDRNNLQEQVNLQKTRCMFFPDSPTGPLHV